MAQLLSSNITGNLAVALDGVAGNFVANNMVGRFTGNANSYIQVDIQNIGTGANSSGDLAITGDIGNDTQYFIDIGWNNSKYNDPAYAIMTANSGYLYTANGNLAIGTANAQKDLVLFAGGTIAADESIRVYGANSDVKISGNVTIATPGASWLMINSSSISPDVSSANQLAIFSKNIANTMLFGTESLRANNLKFDNHQFFSNHPAFKMTGLVRPSGSGTTNVSVLHLMGLSMNIYANSNLITTTANTTFKTAQRRITIGANNSSTTGNASIFANANVTLGGHIAGNPGGGGGYLMVTRFCYETLGANVRSFIGMTNAVASMVTGAGDYDPFLNTAHSIIGVGSNSSVNTLWFLCGPNGGARTAANLGISFVMSTTDLYELTLTVAPGGGSVGYRVRNLSNGAEVSGTQTTNLPQGNIFMQPCMWIKSNTGASSNMSLVNMYLETDN